MKKTSDVKSEEDCIQKTGHSFFKIWILESRKRYHGEVIDLFYHRKKKNCRLQFGKGEKDINIQEKEAKNMR